MAERLLGSYELLRPLARGGMAEVYLARRRGAAGVEKRLVIKRIRPERAADPRFLELFVREARLSVALAHGNIVPVFDFGRVGDELFLAMEHVEGKDLAAALERVAQQGALPDPVLVAYLAAEACQGLDYAHRKRDERGIPLGVVHRDVTPRNVLVSFVGEVKLVDFGVASLQADIGEGKTVRGTPAYMAPEQARGEPVDGRADLFALGVILWEALAGQHAFDTPAGGIRAALEQAKQRTLRPLPDTVPAALREIVARATASDAAARYPDGRAMQQALDAFVVAARAAHPDLPPPSHRLGAWLRELFPDTDSDLAVGSDPGDSPLPAGRAVTFMEDGEDVVRGATQRSVAETIGDAVAAAAPAPAAAASPKSRYQTVVVLTLATALATVLGAFVLTKRSNTAALKLDVPAARLAVTAPTPPPEDPMPMPVPVPVPVPAPVTAPAPVPDVPSKQPAKPVVAALPKRRVTISSTPWSYVTIDGKKPSRETPFSIALTPGKHRLHFENPESGLVFDQIIDVPPDQDLTIVQPLTR